MTIYFIHTVIELIRLFSIGLLIIANAVNITSFFYVRFMIRLYAHAHIYY